LAALRRYYPGFFGALFLVLLRVAIGWHFLYEGTQKILSTPEGKSSFLGKKLPVPEGPPFSSEGYLRNASGPLAPRFRALIPDVDGRNRLDLERLRRQWSADVERIGAHYDLDADQLKLARRELRDREQVADGWFNDPSNAEKVKKYLRDIKAYRDIEENPRALESEKENARTIRKGAEADRRELFQQVDAWTGALRDGVSKLATPDQIKVAAIRGGLIKVATPEQLKEAELPEGKARLATPEQLREAAEYRPPLTPLQKLDMATMWGLSAVGLLLMLGLFTPVAALGGAAYLLSFYLSMPPWPGLPEGITEGHYRYVNKNLIEMLACLALAATPSGLWLGVDALLFGWIGRGRRARDLAAADPPPAARPQPQDRRKFKPR